MTAPNSANEVKYFKEQQLLTYVALLMLLAIRIPIADLILNFLQLFHISTPPSWIESLRLLQDWTFYLWEHVSFAFVGIIIIVNRFDLKSFNIDRYFIAIFVTSGVIYCFYFWGLSGWITALIEIVLFIFFTRKEYKFVNAETDLWRIVIVITVGFFLSLLLIGDSLNIVKVRETIRYLITRIPFLVIEEIIFRGMLWRFLRSLSWPDLKIVILQAVLFWVFHAYFMFSNPTFFWITIPIMSILLGIIVWRSRSITSSTIAHILFNLWAWLD